MNEIKYDLMTIGNHELDKGEEYLGQFIRNLSFPMITSNLNIDTAPFLKAAGLKPFTIFPQYRLAVIGFITNTTKDITPVKTIDVYNPVAIVQSHIDVLHAQGIKRIVCVSHNGYEHDKYLAENTRGISLIIGGHSHSLLLKNQSAPGVVGTYPSEVQNLDGKPTYVVQSHRFGDYLGNVEIQFDENDELVYLKGDPILLDQSIPKDQDLAQQVADYRKTFEADSRHVVAIVQESMDREKCKGNKECSLANLATDSILEYAKSTDCPQCQISLVNVGGLRSGLSKGPISIADVMNVFPFQNNVVKFNMTGQEIFDLLERTAAGESRDRKRIIHLPQFSGLKYTYDPKSPEFSRIRSASVADADGNNLYTPLVKAKMYQVVTTTFVAAGGDAVLTAPVKDTQQVGHETEDTIMDAYLAKRQAPDGSVFVIGNLVQGRITVL